MPHQPKDLSRLPRDVADGQADHSISATDAWLVGLERAWRSSSVTAPRGKAIREVLHATVNHPIALPVVGVLARKLSYSFAAAEALWMIAGDNRVAPLAEHAPRMLQFSDDGVTLAGAYGPRIVEQFDYVVRKLVEDRDTRQAALVIWKPSPPPSRDVPCTLALAFTVRSDRLSCHAYMRSSDVWLGLPYDLFSFSMVTTWLACAHNRLRPTTPVDLGRIYLTAASSHLYEENAEAAREIVEGSPVVVVHGQPIPRDVVLSGRWDLIEASLVACRDKTEATFNDALPWRVRP